MLLLTKVFLHNWHRFVECEIEVEESLYLAGHNGSGKSTVLDALQLILLADLSRVRFNSSAQDRSARSLDSYVRGKMGEDRYLRPGNTVAYLAAEFRSSQSEKALTIGVCIEASPQKSPDRSFFIINSEYKSNFFFSDGFARTRRELKVYLKNHKTPARVFDHVNEYQHELLKAMGGLPERFFDLFLRALTFQPLRDVRSFVEQWLLSPSPLDLETLQRVAERLGDLRVQAQTVSEQIRSLVEIQQQQDEALRFRNLARDYETARDLARLRSVQNTVADLERNEAEILAQQETNESQRAQWRSDISGLQAQQLDLRFAIESSDVGRRKAQLMKVREDFLEKRAVWRARRAKAIEAWKEVASAARQFEDEAIVRAALALSERDGAGGGAGELSTELSRGSSKEELKGSAQDILNQVEALLRQTLDSLAVRRQWLSEKRVTLLEIEDSLGRQREGRGPRLPSHVESYRARVQDALKISVPLLCEVLEVTDPRWQDAVEGVLGARRFQLLVAENRFEEASRLAISLRSRGQGAEVGMLDLERIAKEGRSAQRGSLATRVSSTHAGAARYVDSVLGDVMMADNETDLRRHKRSITPECLMYAEWSVRALSLSRIRPWQIGHAAQASHIADLEDKLKAASIKAAALQKDVAAHDLRAQKLQALADALRKASALATPSDEEDIDEALRAVEAELGALDDSSLSSLEETLLNIGSQLETALQQERALSVESGRLDARLVDVRTSKASQLSMAHSLEQSWSAFEESHPEVALRAEQLVEERKGTGGFPALVRNLETSAKGFETRSQNEIQKLTELATSYNVRFQFSADAGRIDEVRYRDERLRLELTALPEFASRIDDEQRKAEHELREHILHRLREQIQQARTQLDRVNSALKGLEFHNESYRFKWSVADDFREHYELLNETKNLGTGSLVESDFYRKNKVAFDRFFEILTRTPQNEVERSLQSRITDYRAYLDYDIEVCNVNGQVSRLSRIIGQTSGGETQTPFYLTIAASFLQLYSPKGDVRARETPRIVAFDEAFSKMDQERIASTLDLFHKFGLQVVTATPLERCEYLVPKMRTSLVLTAVGDHVLVEPYRNYLASLEEAAANNDDA